MPNNILIWLKICLSGTPYCFYQPHMRFFRLPCLRKVKSGVCSLEEVFPILNLAFSPIDSYELQKIHGSKNMYRISTMQKQRSMIETTNLILFSSIPPTDPSSGRILSLINTLAPGFSAGIRACKILTAYTSDQL
jgi:hypothetical protein